MDALSLSLNKERAKENQPRRSPLDSPAIAALHSASRDRHMHLSCSASRQTTRAADEVFQCFRTLWSEWGGPHELAVVSTEQRRNTPLLPIIFSLKFLGRGVGKPFVHKRFPHSSFTSINLSKTYPYTTSRTRRFVRVCRSPRRCRRHRRPRDRGR